MRRCPTRAQRTSSGLTLALWVTFCAGCFPSTTGGGAGAGGSGGGAFTAPTLELTVSGVHFGPAAPDSGSSASLVTTRDTLGNVSGSSFRLNATLTSAGAGCSFAFDTYGSAITVGQYTISSQATGTTPSGIVYATGSQRVQTPGGGAACSGSDCDGGAFVISAVDATHVYGYVQATMNADSGAGQASIVCTFYVHDELRSLDELRAQLRTLVGLYSSCLAIANRALVVRKWSCVTSARAGRQQ
jgi:hypothetical protein